MERLYYIWRNMKRRCNMLSIDRTIKELNYINITYCREWETYQPFRQWALANGYQEHLTIDRINNNLGYSPDNCRWVTRSEQNRNQRTKGKSKFRGVAKSQNKLNPWQCHAPNCTYVGQFKTELAAALAYDDKAFDMLGIDAKLNFPERKPNVTFYFRESPLRDLVWKLHRHNKRQLRSMERFFRLYFRGCAVQYRPEVRHT